MLAPRDEITNTEPLIFCPFDFNGIAQHDIGRRAIQGAQQLARQAIYQVTGFETPASIVVFKDRHFESDIRATYGKTANWSKIRNRDPVIACINTAEQAAEWSSRI